MSPDDPRHGTTRGFHAGCDCGPCRAAIARYQKGIRYNRRMGRRLSVPAIGAQRRLQALMCLGWTGNDIAEAAGVGHRNYVRRILVGQKGKPCTWIERKTFDTIVKVYDELSMRLPEPAPHRARCATMARKRGWLPPLAWDDDRIDDPEFIAPRFKMNVTKMDFDPVAVDRFLAGDYHIRLTITEKREVVRRWPGSLYQLEQLGWKPERYVERGVAS